MIDITQFKDIARQYKVVFFDSFGVLRNYQGAIDGAVETLDMLRDNAIDYYVITNDASRSPELLASSFEKMGFENRIPCQKIISSGMMAKQFLDCKISQGKVVHLGTEQSALYISDLGLEPISIDDVSFDKNDLRDIKGIVFFDDDGFDRRVGINNVVNLIRKINVPVVVANTDDFYPVSRSNVGVAIGGIANFVEDVVDKYFIKFGKPDVQIFSYAFEMVNASFPCQKSDILMVGDTLMTDIIGGNKFGIDTALVLSGNTREEYVYDKIKRTGIIPSYICNSIAI